MPISWANPFDYRYWKCKHDLLCIDEMYVCDGWKSCPNEADEDPVMCAQWNCTDWSWKCDNGLVCNHQNSLCNHGWGDCSDRSNQDPVMCAEPVECPAGYKRVCQDGRCRPEHLLCDGMIHCNNRVDEDPVMCARWNCLPGDQKCKDGLECIHQSLVCDGNPRGQAFGCLDRSDEDPTMCTQWNCPASECQDGTPCNFTKCADNLQCIERGAICDGRHHCHDKSDEMCDDRCLKKALKLEEKDIVKNCQEDSSVCVSVKQYCDGIAQCPDASDETQAGCTCEHWGMRSCNNEENQMKGYCLNPNWASNNAHNRSTLKCLDFLQKLTSPIEIRESHTGYAPTLLLTRTTRDGTSLIN